MKSCKFENKSPIGPGCLCTNPEMLRVGTLGKCEEWMKDICKFFEEA